MKYIFPLLVLFLYADYSSASSGMWSRYSGCRDSESQARAELQQRILADPASKWTVRSGDQCSHGRWAVYSWSGTTPCSIPGEVWSNEAQSCVNPNPPPACPEYQKQVHYPHPDGHSVSICINSTDDLTDGPDACKETGRFYQESSQLPGLKLCTTQCLTGSLDHFCLAPKEDECTKDSPNYAGYLGWGSEAKAYCHQSCPAGSTFGIVETDGVRAEGCIPTDAKPPQCDAGGVVVMNEFGFVCESPVAGNKPPEQPNTDTDGDGIPDTYKPENDPLAELKELAKVNQNLNKSNDRLGNLDNKMDGVNKNLKDGLGNLNQTAKGISDKLSDATQAPGGQERWLNVATFGESTTAFMNVVRDAPLIAPLQLGSVSGSCPVYSLDISAIGLGSYSIDFHCQIMNQYGGWLGTLFLGVYALVGIRIVFSS